MATVQNVKWDDHFYVLAYRTALTGETDNRIARRLGVGLATFHKWMKQKPALADALSQARARGAGLRQFMLYVGERMPSDLKPLWEMLSSDDPAVRERAVQSTHVAGRRQQQHLFIHAWIAMNFNLQKTCEATGIKPLTYKAWKKNDKQFQRLLEMVADCRGDFYENALVEKVAEGDGAAIIFANRTYNKNRGYDAKVTVEVGGQVEHKHVISVSELSTDTKRQLLEEIRKKKLTQLEDRSNILDAEFEPLNGEAHESD